MLMKIRIPSALLLASSTRLDLWWAQWLVKDLQHQHPCDSVFQTCYNITQPFPIIILISSTSMTSSSTPPVASCPLLYLLGVEWSCLEELLNTFVWSGPQIRGRSLIKYTLTWPCCCTNLSVAFCNPAPQREDYITAVPLIHCYMVYTLTV